MHPQVSKLSLALHLKFAVICDEFIDKCCAFLPSIGGIFECTPKFCDISYKTSLLYSSDVGFFGHFIYIMHYFIYNGSLIL